MSKHLSGRTFKFHRLLPAGLFICSACFAGPLQAVELKKVDRVLATEAAGKPIDRRQALADQTDEASQWQAGRILIDGRWLNIEDSQTHKLGSKVNAYLKEREAQKNLDVEAHRHLAKWCQSHQLPDMARVHWKAVTVVVVDDDQARKALGHKNVDGNWFTKEELKHAADDAKQERVELKQWMPQVRKIVAKLQSSDTETKLAGMKDLEKIETVAAVTALKYGALQLEPTIAVPMVSKIKSLRSKDACLALCEIALADPTSQIGRLAIEGLKEYDEHFYVPELLQMIEMPVTVKQQCVYLPNGSLAIQRAYSKETANAKEYSEVLKLVAVFPSQIADFQTAAAGAFEQREELGGHSQSITRTLNVPLLVAAMNPQAANSAEILSAIKVRSENREAETWNGIQNQHERNAKHILSTISGLPSEQSAETYWNWWPAFNDVSPTNKSTINNYVLDQSEYINLPTTAVGTMTSSSTGVTPQVPTMTSPTREVTHAVLMGTPSQDHSSCLIAGTLVQTSEGLKSIDLIKVGDSITSIDVESGKISLQPATHATVRTADTTYLITLVSGESIRATGGHDWWVVGKGWRRSRQLEPKQFMRTGDSSVEITKVEKIDEPIKVYNMIVDENHTYFVGKDRLLSWDVTSLQPTLQTAPGQSKQMYVTTK